ncbi:MAG: phosphatidylserine decarboxylase [Clostridia bacterium]|nr:phosphatidylserine decarboxylase [Clostridia bacterium]
MSKPSKTQRFLYNTVTGRCLLKVLTRPKVSDLGGRIVSSRPSRLVIRRFVKKHEIDMSQCVKTRFHSFNDFFTRELHQEARPIPSEEGHLFSPCDAHLSIYPIGEDTSLAIKNSVYTISELLGGDEELARRYEGGVCCVFRMTPRHYHRYCYIDDGVKGKNHRINGVLHTVHPISGARYAVYSQNTREYSVLSTRRFGEVVHMEVGAMMVGRINNYHQEYRFRRGEEKGRFEFGGSTIVMLFRRDAVRFFPHILESAAKGEELGVLRGESIGEAVRALNGKV